MGNAESSDDGTLMDRIYRHQRHIYDLTRKFFLLGRDQLIDALDVPAGGAVLEIGCGTGRNLISAARAYPGAQFLGVDISTSMLEVANRNIEKAGLSNRVRVARGDAAQFDPESLLGRIAFERVFFSYSLSMIPSWQAAIENAIHCLSPEGRMLIVDFGQQERLPRPFRNLLFAWLARFHVSPRADMITVLSTKGQKKDLIVEKRTLFGGYAWLASAYR
ncbi:MAG: class I SAM-dependent methyltransferase [Stappiaceae bacterium]